MPEKKKHSWSKSPNYDEYNSRRWRSWALANKKQNPLCVECLKEGIATPVEATDHTKPVRDGGAMYDPNNVQSLCKRHHLIKTNQETRARKK